MNRRGIQETFWLQATRKAGTSGGAEATQNTQDLPSQSAQVPGVPEKDELTAKSGPWYTHSQMSHTEGNRPKRLRTQLTSGEEAVFIPPENPCFINSADVGRAWHTHHTTKNDKRHGSRSIPFRIMTYNVLADSLLKSHPALYEDCCAWYLEWEYRKKNLLKEILHYNADILCLQEVEEQHYEDWFKPELGKAGYQGTYKKRTGEKVDGCATFYKESKFRILTHSFFNYKMENVPVMDRDNIAMLTLLYPRYKDGGTCNNTALCVVNTHLLFNRNRGDIKLLQLACLFAEIHKLKNEFVCDKMGQNKPLHNIKKMPVVLSGDFNTTPFCPLYDFIVKGFLNYKGMSKKSLSGQNPPHHTTYRERDVIKGNIVPLEMGLSTLCVWDVNSVQGTESKAITSSTQTNSIFANDDFGTVNSNWQEYSCGINPLHHGPSSLSALTLQHGGTSAIPQLMAHCSRGTFRGHIVPPFDPRQAVGGPPRYHQRGTGTIPQLMSQDIQGSSRGHRESFFDPRKVVGGIERYQVPPSLPNPKYNPSCTIIRHHLYFWSVYKHYLPNKEIEVTTYHDKEPSCTVDFVFFAPGRVTMCGTCRQRHTLLELTSTLNLLSEEHISLLGGLPNQKLSSDHLALVAGFILHV